MKIEFQSIGDFAIIISGYAFKSEWFGDGDDKVIRIGDLQDNTINTDSALMVDAKLHKISDNFKIHSNDILIALSGATVGKIAVASIKDIGAYINQRVAIIRANNPVTANYLKFFFSGKFLDELLKNAGGAAQPNLSPKQLSLMKIPFPPLEEQRRIAELLDKADSLIQKRKASIAKLDELLHTTFIDMFGNPAINPKSLPLKNLEELGNWASGGTPSRSNPDFFTGDIPWYTSGELNTIYVGSKSIEKITNDAVKLSSTKLIPIGSILIGMYDTAAFKSSITTVSSTCNQAIAYSHLNSEVNTLYAYWVIQLMKESLKKLQRGVRQKNLNLSMIRSIKIPFPSKELQDKWAEFATAVEGQKNKMQAQLEAQETLFKALQQQAFSGQL